MSQPPDLEENKERQGEVHSKPGNNQDAAPSANSRLDLRSQGGAGSFEMPDIAPQRLDADGADPVHGEDKQQAWNEGMEKMQAILQKGQRGAQRGKKEAADAQALIQSRLLAFEGAKFCYHGEEPVYYDQASLCVFRHTSSIRKAFVWLATWTHFDNFVTVMILINSINLGIKDYDGRLHGEAYVSQWNQNLDYVGYGLSAIFLVECIVKIVAMGFCMHKNSYLRDRWNWLDFFVVLVSLLDFVPALDQYSSLKVLRTARILRPLRSINKLPTLKALINSLLKSVPGLANVAFFLFFVLSIFGILGVHTFKGASYNRCRTTPEPLKDPFKQKELYPAASTSLESDYLPWQIDYDADWLCSSDADCKIYLGAEDPTRTYKCGAPIDYGLPVATDNLKSDELVMFNIINFDNYGRAMLAIFVAITLEGWVLMMYSYMDAFQPVFAVLFFVTLVVFGAFFALNLVLAQIMESFYAQQRDDEQAAERRERELEKAEADELVAKNQREALEEQKEGEEQKPDETDRALAIGKDDTCFQLPAIGLEPTTNTDAVRRIAENEKRQDAHLRISEDSALAAVGRLESAGQEANTAVKNNYAESQAQHADPEAIHADVDPAPVTQEEKEEADEETTHDKRARLRAENNRCVQFFYALVTSPHFNFFIFTLIIANTVVLAADDYPGEPQTRRKAYVIGVLNEFFCWFFFAEMILKLIALHPKNYFMDNFNAFDSFVVVVSLVDWTISKTVDPENIGDAASALQALRAMRLLRVIKIMRTWGELQDMLSKIGASLKDIAFFGILLFLFMYISALLGMELFANYARFNSQGEMVEDLVTATNNKVYMTAPRANFDDAGAALTTVFIIVLGEDWPGVMYNYTRVYGNMGWSVIPYFMIIFCLGNLMMLSLFTAILLRNFEGGDDEEGSDEVQELDSEEEEERRDAEEAKPRQTAKQKRAKLAMSIKVVYYEAFGTAAVIKGIQAEQTALLIAIDGEPLNVSERKVLPVVDDLDLLNDDDMAPQTTMQRKIAAKFLRAAAEAKVDLMGGDGGSGKSAENAASPDDTGREQLMGDHGARAPSPARPAHAKTLQPSAASRAGRLAVPGAEDGHEIQDSEPSLSPRAAEEAAAEGKAARKSTKAKGPRLGGVLGKRSMSLGTASLQHMQQIYEVKEEDAHKNRAAASLHGTSLFCFGRGNRFRQFCHQLSTHKYFEWVILLFITFSTVLLAIERPLDDPKSYKNAVLKVIDYAMTGIFAAEMLTKILAVGFALNGQSSYIRNGWNVLDFVIVMSSVAGLLPGVEKISFLKALRMLRILRPLRLISRNKGLKLSIMSLIASIPDIANLMLIVFFFLFMMGILGTTLFCGKFYRCHTDAMIAEEASKHLHARHDYGVNLDVIRTNLDCLNYGGEWINPDLNFDTTMQSVLTLATIQTTEGWISVMWDSVDSVGQGEEPVRNANRVYIFLYITLIVLLCLLFLNLFVGVVIDTFNKEKTRLTLNHMLKPMERQWLEVQILAYSGRPVVYIKEAQPTVGWFRNQMIRLTNNPAFDSFIMICILLNTLVLGIVWYDMSEGVKGVLAVFNYVFMVVFTLECIFKLIAMKCAYFKDGWNRFDFVVVVGTAVVLVISWIPAIGLDLGMQATLVRILRILRVLRIVKRARQLKIIVETIMEALPALASLGTLLMLFIFLFTIVGIQIFSFVQLQGALNYHVNFQYFSDAFLLLLRCATGEAWNELMFDTARPYSITFQCDLNPTYESIRANGGKTNGCGFPVVATVYYLAYQVVVSQIFLNLFIAIVVDTFIGQANAFNLPVKQLDIDTFVQLWKVYDPLATEFLLWSDMDSFLSDLADSDADFFTHNQEEMKDAYMRENWTKHMEFPLHKSFQYYNFFDVLQLVSRHACQSKYYLEKVETLDSMKTKIKSISLLQRSVMTDEEVTIRANRRITMLAQEEFHNMIHGIQDLDKKIELVEEVRGAADGVSKRLRKSVDQFKGLLAEDMDGYYTSRHLIIGSRVVAIWREKILRVKFLADLRAGIVTPEGAIIERAPTGTVNAQANAEIKGLPAITEDIQNEGGQETSRNASGILGRVSGASIKQTNPSLDAHCLPRNLAAILPSAPTPANEEEGDETTTPLQKSHNTTANLADADAGSAKSEKKQ